jgi:hypothetical protein
MRGGERTYNDHCSCQRLFSRRHAGLPSESSAISIQSRIPKHHEVIIPLLAYDLSTASILSKIALGCLGYTIFVGWKLMTRPCGLLS